MTRKCWTLQCDRAAVEGVQTEGVIDQSDGKQPGIVYTCTCGWKRIDPVPGAWKSNGWTSSRSPCRREGDVDAR